LPDDQRDHWIALWHEFESGTSAEGVLARALDRVQPALLHEATDAVTWQKYGTTHDQIQSKMQVVHEAAPLLWHRVQRIIARARSQGKLL
jgi:putative hydrolases of HD superfamily